MTDFRDTIVKLKAWFPREAHDEGTGKTWFALHYARTALQRYQDAKWRGVERPRLPLVIPLRDYAKAVSVESLFSEFFFRKYEIPIPCYSAFEQLNRMGKLLLIFDGFDEMAARVNRQQMVNNFWELAKVVVPGAKVILTCRTEHFPEAKEGRALLSAELQASTIHLPFETPRFEVLELEKFNDEQIRQVLAFQSQPQTVEKVINNPALLDLARRPVMTDLVIEALPEIEAGKPVDIARVYLYAVQRKMERDTKEGRTFTSLADKLYFLCELSWEMLSTDRMSINYLEFPDQIRTLFPTQVQEEKDLDYWKHDMMGQTMLIRNAEGDYSPAHRSLLEFFIAYKLVAELGVLAVDFTVLAQAQTSLDGTATAQDYTWSEYFQRQRGENGEVLPIAPLQSFTHSTVGRLVDFLAKAPLAKAVLDLAVPMLDGQAYRERLLRLVQTTQGKTQTEVGHFGGNLVRLLLQINPYALEQSNLSRTVLLNVNFALTSLRWTNLMGADLTNCVFVPILGIVHSVKFSPDNQLLVVGDSNGTVQVWELPTGRSLLLLQGHRATVRSVAFSPDGQYIVSGSADYTVRLWDLQGKPIGKPFQGHKDEVWAVTFSPDGQHIASGSADARVRLWDLQGKPIGKPFQGHEAGIRSVAFSPDGQYIISGSADDTVRLWDLQGKPIGKPFQGHEAGIRSVDFSPDGQYIVSGSTDCTVRLWDLQGNPVGEPFRGHDDRVRSVAFSPDKQYIVSGSEDHTVRLWDLQGNPVGEPFRGHKGTIRSVSLSPDGQYIVSGSEDHTVRLWDLQGSPVGKPFQGYEAGIRSVAFSPDGQYIVSGSEDHAVRLWDLQGNPVGKPFQGHTDRVRSVAFSPDGQYIASSSNDCTVRLWDLQGNPVGKPFQGHTDRVRSVAFSPDGQYIASSSNDCTVRLWDLQDSSVGEPFRGHDDRVRSVAFSPDGQYILSGSRDRTVRLWNLQGNPVEKPLRGHEAGIRSVAFSPDGQYIVSGSEDHTVRLWNLQGNPVGKPFRGHDDRVRSVAFSPDGQYIVSGSEDHTVRLWNLQGNPVGKPFQGHTDWVRSVAFSPDGQYIVSGSVDEMIRIWNAITGECLQKISYKRCVGLNVTGTSGLTSAQRTALKLMGAFDEEDE